MQVDRRIRADLSRYRFLAARESGRARTLPVVEWAYWSALPPMTRRGRRIAARCSATSSTCMSKRDARSPVYSDCRDDVWWTSNDRAGPVVKGGGLRSALDCTGRAR